MKKIIKLQKQELSLKH